MSLSLMMPQKYCGFSTKLDSPESSMPSSEEGGLTPKFIKRSETAKSSSFPRTDEPVHTGQERGGGMITRFYNIQCDGSSQLFGLTINNYRRESFYKMAVFHAQTMNLGCDAVWGCLHWRWENFEAGDPRQSSSLQSLGSSVPLELICFSSCLLLFTLLRAVIKTLAALLQDVRATESKHTALVESVIGALVKKQRRVQTKSSGYRAKNGRGVSAMHFYRGCVSDGSLHCVAS